MATALGFRRRLAPQPAEQLGRRYCYLASDFVEINNALARSRWPAAASFTVE